MLVEICWTEAEGEQRASVCPLAFSRAFEFPRACGRWEICSERCGLVNGVLLLVLRQSALMRTRLGHGVHVPLMRVPDRAGANSMPLNVPNVVLPRSPSSGSLADCVDMPSTRLREAAEPPQKTTEVDGGSATVPRSAPQQILDAGCQMGGGSVVVPRSAFRQALDAGRGTDGGSAAVPPSEVQQAIGAGREMGIGGPFGGRMQERLVGAGRRGPGSGGNAIYGHAKGNGIDQGGWRAGRGSPGHEPGDRQQLHGQTHRGHCHEPGNEGTDVGTLGGNYRCPGIASATSGAVSVGKLSGEGLGVADYGELPTDGFSACPRWRTWSPGRPA